MGDMYGRRRSSRQEVFCRKGVLKNFVKFTGKQLCKNLLFNTVAGLSSATMLKISKNLCFIEHLRWLLLSAVSFHIWNTAGELVGKNQ